MEDTYSAAAKLFDKHYGQPESKPGIVPIKEPHNGKKYPIFINELTIGVRILLDPPTQTEKPMNLFHALLFYYKLSLIPTLTEIICYIVLGSMAPFSSVTADISVWSIYNWALLPAFVILVSMIYHLFGAVFLFDEPFDNTFTGVVYAIVPVVLLTPFSALFSYPNPFSVTTNLIVLDGIIVLLSLWVFMNAIDNQQHKGKVTPVLLGILSVFIIVMSIVLLIL